MIVEEKFKKVYYDLGDLARDLFYYLYKYHDMKSFMKSLKEYIAEGLLDRVKNKEVNHDALIKEFLEENYKFFDSYTIKETKNGFVVDVKGSIWVKNINIATLTNEFFEFGEVSGDFKCFDCSSLTSLEGAPEKVSGYFLCDDCKSLETLKGAPKEVRGFNCAGCESLKSLEGAPEKCGSFYCSGCKSLKSLEGAPKEVRGSFYCNKCNSLTSLEGAPERVGDDFSCNNCKSLTSLEGAPKEVGGLFSCSKCKSLKSLKGAPKEIGGVFSCRDCGIQFTEEDVRKHIKVVKKIYV
jgi:hypothetical protein